MSLDCLGNVNRARGKLAINLSTLEVFTKKSLPRLKPSSCPSWINSRKRHPTARDTHRSEKLGVISQEVLQAFERRQVKSTIERSADAIAVARKTSKAHDAEAADNPLQAPFCPSK
jgi:hypothetical protein